MSERLSRTKLAVYIADEIDRGRGARAVQQLAAYIVETRRIAEVELITRSIYEVLEARGHIVADVTTAEAIDVQLQTQIAELLGADQLEVRTHIDPDVLGGIRIDTPTRQLDATMARRLIQLRKTKV